MIRFFILVFVVTLCFMYTILAIVNNKKKAKIFGTSLTLIFIAVLIFFHFNSINT